MQEQLLGYLLGALEDSEQQAIAARLKSDPQLQKELWLVRQRLGLPSAGRCEFDPPPGLAERTCHLVAAHRHRKGRLAQEFAGAPKKDGEVQRRGGARFREGGPPSHVVPVPTAQRQGMSPGSAPPSSVVRIRWHDVAVAAGVVMAASLLIVPALNYSRFQSRLTGCQDRLREIGVAMKQYSSRHNHFFPRIPTDGKASVAGIYAPILLGDNLLGDFRVVICPGSELASQSGFRVPSLEEIYSASRERLGQLCPCMGGSYGYCLGHMQGGVYQGTRDLNRANFALMADAPSRILPGFQSLNHGGRGQNVLFEDGRVEFLTSSKPYDGADDYYANDYGQVAAGAHPNDSVIGSSAAVPVMYVGRPND